MLTLEEYTRIKESTETQNPEAVQAGYHYVLDCDVDNVMKVTGALEISGCKVKPVKRKEEGRLAILATKGEVHLSSGEIARNVGILNSALYSDPNQAYRWVQTLDEDKKARLKLSEGESVGEVVITASGELSPNSYAVLRKVEQ